MLNWSEYRSELLGHVGELGKLLPDTLAGLQTMSAVGKLTVHLEPKSRELISLAVAYPTQPA